MGEITRKSLSAGVRVLDLWLVDRLSHRGSTLYAAGQLTYALLLTYKLIIRVMSDSGDEYDELEITDELATILDAPLDDPPADISLESLEFGSSEYCDVYRGLLVQQTRAACKKTPYEWQLEAALATHLGRDVFILAGTGFGKTLPFIMNCWIDKKLIVWIVTPLNALANQQVKTFKGWGIESVAVNSTTTRSGLYRTTQTRRNTQEIRAGKFQVIISSIEAFTDTSRLLPIIKSPRLAQQHKQVVVVDEAHCIAKWGKSFRPKYAVAGEMRLIVPGHTPYVAATATANELTREAIKQVLRFNEGSLFVNLGNHRPKLAYSVHRMKKAKSSISELLDYFIDKHKLPGNVLIFVDSRPLGQLALSLLRNHLAPAIRYKVQIYHAFRSDNVKELLASMFEKEDGFGVLICTEALTMSITGHQGVDYQHVTHVFQLLAPIDSETLAQRGGRAGRNGETVADVVIMAQDSVFEDSREGQKRLLKTIKKEEVNPPGPTNGKTSKKALEAAAKKLVAPSKAKRSAREYTSSILKFINTTECRMKVLDEEFGNPARPEPQPPCLCDNCIHSRGELTLWDRLQRRSAKRRHSEDEPPDGQEDGEEIQDEPQDENEEEEEENVDEGDPDVVEVTPATKRRKSSWRSGAKRKPYAEALTKWRDDKFYSPECEDWDVDDDWILSTKILNLMARDPRITSIESLGLLQPAWTHAERWGAEIIDVLTEVSGQQQRIEDEKRQRAAEKQRVVDENRAKYIEQARLDNLARRQNTAEASNSGQNAPRPPKRPRLSSNATIEEKAAREDEKKARRRQYDRERYQRRKNQVKIEPEESKPHILDDVQSLEPISPAQPAPVAPDPTPVPQTITFQAKQELIETQIDFSAPTNDSTVQNDLPLSPSTPHPSFTFPNTPGPSVGLRFEHATVESMRTTLQQPTPVSQPKNKKKSADIPTTPSQPKPRRRPKLKVPQPQDESKDSP
ncbi:hypothetical protein FRC09_012390 [Ceratobasidium sp. 395]|nr:hypothetical protein FRC09_012390 [Ceratobasidium sp. 395]